MSGGGSLVVDRERELAGRNRRLVRLLLAVVATLAVATLLAGIRW